MPEANGESIGATSQRDKSDAKRDGATMSPFNPVGKQLLFSSAKGGSVFKRVRERIHASEETILTYLALRMFKLEIEYTLFSTASMS